MRVALRYKRLFGVSLILIITSLSVILFVRMFGVPSEQETKQCNRSSGHCLTGESYTLRMNATFIESVIFKGDKHACQLTKRWRMVVDSNMNENFPNELPIASTLIVDEAMYQKMQLQLVATIDTYACNGWQLISYAPVEGEKTDDIVLGSNKASIVIPLGVWLPTGKFSENQLDPLEKANRLMLTIENGKATYVNFNYIYEAS